MVLSLPLSSAEAPPLLTLAEREVARAVVRGLSNRAIAAERGVSMQTVANQLSSAFRKLGVGSRAELVRALSAPSLAR